MTLPVILSGGIGSRLWPLSRVAHPKPFIKLGDGQSLLQKTYKRAVEVANSDEVLTVTNRDLFFYTKDEFEELGGLCRKNTFLLEPVGRNSAAAIAAAAQYVLDHHGRDCIMLVMPADHLIEDAEAFSQAVGQAEQFASDGKLVTFGIKPQAPETGYGYILADGHRVQEFIEKPDLETAEKYIANGNCFWNAGIFCMSAGRFLEELSRYAPDIARQTAIAVAGAARSAGADWQQLEMQHRDFAGIESISVDYAVFEKSQNAAMVSCDIGWSDIGSWNEFGTLHPADDHRNRILGNALCQDTHGCIIHSRDRLVATLGVNNLIVADTADALLVARKDRAQDVRELVDTLQAREEGVYKEFPTVHRPWGSYTILQEGDGFKLKRVEVKPGARLSLQSHQHRSEHWVVVGGKALATNDDELIELYPNQSTYIPQGNKHRLENPGLEMLVVIEVQCGSYLGEDDIVRYEDVYGRPI